jgi:glycosyltransferase involved in cell wall biosynthesis
VPSHARIQVLPPPFPGRLAAAGQSLAGAPAIVLFGSAGWEPNRRGELRFVNEIWPLVRAASPTAALHWFAGSAGPAGSTGASGVGRPDRPGVVVHRSPATSAEAFAPGAILVLPLDIASGVRMRVLEAWARGVVVVASPEAASGLDAADGRELLLARSGPEYAHAIARLATVEGLADRLIAAGRERLAVDHAPESFAAGFVALLAQLAERPNERPDGAVRR